MLNNLENEKITDKYATGASCHLQLDRIESQVAER